MICVLRGSPHRGHTRMRGAQRVFLPHGRYEYHQAASTACGSSFLCLCGGTPVSDAQSPARGTPAISGDGGAAQRLLTPPLKHRAGLSLCCFHQHLQQFARNTCSALPWLPCGPHIAHATNRGRGLQAVAGHATTSRACLQASKQRSSSVLKTRVSLTLLDRQSCHCRCLPHLIKWWHPWLISNLSPGAIAVGSRWASTAVMLPSGTAWH